ncbi:hypothetical protein HID58_031057 [Brassica napus]|uniref:Branched-chain-amino-acid aminotransferase n=1 Tax=Brassica napus TaxID=3708 RepID=A0ABQ8CJY1_BRANA|nr:hypothetical protein HID58_031057 [Brassica napus]
MALRCLLKSPTTSSYISKICGFRMHGTKAVASVVEEHVSAMLRSERMKSMLMWTGTTSDSVLYQQITCSPPKVVEKETSNKVALAGLIEGMKAYRGEDGRVLMFRPELNAMRMKNGAERMCMHSPSVQQFMEGVKQTVLANKRWVPPPGKGSLYLRPLLFGSGASLGVSAASEYTFVVFGSPVQNYFKEGTAALNLYVEEVIPRAYIGGTGAVKAISNYGPVLDAMRSAKARGFSDVLYLDAETKKNIEEVSAANIFLVKGNTIVTPATNGTILRGIIRESVIEIALDLGYKVEERVVPVEEMKEAEEVFCTGTAAGIASVGSITFQNIRTEYKVGDGLVTQQLRSILVGIQNEFSRFFFIKSIRSSSTGSAIEKMFKAISSLRKSLVLPLHSNIRTLQTFSKYNAQAASALREKPLYQDDEYADVDWDNLGFGLTPADYMYVMKCSKDGEFTQGELSRFGNIQLSPSAGTKAYRKENGKLLLFRPDHNAVRMQLGAERMLIPSPSVDQFVDAVKQTAYANKRWVPPSGKGSLYIRPLLMGSGPILGLGPSPEYTFIVYASPVGNYFKEGIAALNLYVEEEYVRAAPGGAGGVKSITNYAPVLKALSRAKSRGFSDVLYLDSVKKKYLEEASSCNVFVVKGRTISTPATNGTILEGVTRKSVMEIASDQGYEVVEKSVHVDEVMEADEVFCTGTAVGVAPVGTITYQDKRVEYETGDESVCQKLRSVLVGIQTGSIEDTKGWVTCIN